MQLTRELDEHPLTITGVDGVRVRVGQTWLDTSFYVGQQQLQPWVPRRFDEIDAPSLQRLLDHGPELILIGTGPRVQLLPPVLQAQVLARRCGLECMRNDAAARTYNLLLGEGRAVLAAFLI